MDYRPDNFIRTIMVRISRLTYCNTYGSCAYVPNTIYVGQFFYHRPDFDPTFNLQCTCIYISLKLKIGKFPIEHYRVVFFSLLRTTQFPSEFVALIFTYIMDVIWQHVILAHARKKHSHLGIDTEKLSELQAPLRFFFDL